jgi:hypothetical protein
MRSLVLPTNRPQIAMRGYPGLGVAVDKASVACGKSPIHRALPMDRECRLHVELKSGFALVMILATTLA